MRKMSGFVPYVAGLALALLAGADGYADETVLVASTSVVEAATQVAEEAGPIPAPEYYCCPTERRMQLGGWIETGMWANEYGSQDGIENGQALGRLSNTGWHVNQLWLFAEREIDSSCGFDWGFRTDAMFGTEAGSFQSWVDGSFDGHSGLSGDDYGFAMPQAYVTVGYNGWDLTLGKFGTPMGYESIMAPDNVFYSHSYLYDHEPSSHTGIMLDKQLTDRFSFFGGLTTGADTGFGNEYGDFGLLGGFEYQMTCRLSLTYGFMWNNVHANENRESYAVWDLFGGESSASALDAEEMMHSLVINYNLSDNLQYVCHLEYASLDVDEIGKLYKHFGIANYLFYQLTDRTTVGLRGEWFRMWNDTDMADGDFTAAESCYEMAFGLNYKLSSNISLRPEVRYDWVFDNGYNNDAKFGCDMAEGEQFSAGFAIVGQL